MTSKQWLSSDSSDEGLGSIALILLFHWKEKEERRMEPGLGGGLGMDAWRGQGLRQILARGRTSERADRMRCE
jgi:hypothetical protein